MNQHEIEKLIAEALSAKREPPKEEPKALRAGISIVKIARPKTAADGTARGTRFQIVASTGVRDRDGEIIEPKGWVIPDVLPKVLYGHDSYAFPIGKITRARKSADAGLVLDVELADAIPDHVDAVVAGALIRGGFLDQGSVGFKPLKWTEPDGSQHDWAKGEFAWGINPGRVYTKQELFEFSIVPVPANPESVVLALRSLRSPGGKGTMLDVVAKAAIRLRREKARASQGAIPHLSPTPTLETPPSLSPWEEFEKSMTTAAAFDASATAASGDDFFASLESSASRAGAEK